MTESNGDQEESAGALSFPLRGVSKTSRFNRVRRAFEGLRSAQADLQVEIRNAGLEKRTRR